MSELNVLKNPQRKLFFFNVIMGTQTIQKRTFLSPMYSEAAICNLAKIQRVFFPLSEWRLWHCNLLWNTLQIFFATLFRLACLSSWCFGLLVLAPWNDMTSQESKTAGFRHCITFSLTTWALFCIVAETLTGIQQGIVKHGFLSF